MADEDLLEAPPKSTEAIARKNEDCFEELLASLELGLGSFQLFIASCDPDLQRRDIVERYERELGGEVRTLRGMLDWDQPSLRQAIATVLEKAEEDDRDSVVTVMGAESLDALLG